ncbi:uncharacterized protein LOC143300461 isoform X2 [Babylonia areolata]
MAEVRRAGGPVGRERSRGSELDIQRAVLAARNPKESKFGECLINVHTKQDPILKLRLGKISTEMKRMEFKMQQVKQHFVKTSSCLNHEPLLLVERPPSPQVRRRAQVMEVCGEDPQDLIKPGYMRPLRSRCRTPSTLTTIDAFTLKTRKKRNVWEEAMDDKEPPQFRSTVRPSAKLTRHERAALQIGWDAHKPRVDVTAKDKNKAESPRPPREVTAAVSDTLFVTHLPRKELPRKELPHKELPHKDLPHTPDGRLLKSVQLVESSAAAAPPLASDDSAEKAPPTAVERKRRVAIVEKPFFITERSG